MHSKMLTQKLLLNGTFGLVFSALENPFLTTGYRILRRRCFPLIQPGDLPGSLGGPGGVPNRIKMLPKDARHSSWSKLDLRFLPAVKGAVRPGDEPTIIASVTMGIKSLHRSH